MVVVGLYTGDCGTTLYSIERTPKRVPKKKMKTIATPPTCLLKGTNKKASPVKGQGHQTTGAPVINPHNLQFGTVDWSALGLRAVDCGCGCLPKIETPDTNTTPPASIKPKEMPFKKVPRKNWSAFSDGTVKVTGGLLGGGPKVKKDRAWNDLLIEASKKKNPSASNSGKDILPQACQSPAPSIASSLDRRLISLTEDNCKGDTKVEDSVKGSVIELDDDTDSEYLAKARSNKYLKFENRGNQCALSTALHLLLDQPKIRESILAKRKDHALGQNLHFLLVDDNQQDSLAEILELLGLKPGIQHDQDEVMSRLMDGLLKDCKLDMNLFSSYRFQTVKCHRCHHLFAPHEESYNIIRLKIKPGENMQRMSRLVDREMTVYNDECGQCKTDNVMRITNPDLTTTPDYLLAIIMRYTIDENDLTRKINVKVKEADSFVYAGQTYELSGFTVHSGETGSSGHYRAYHASGVEYDDQGGTSPTLRKIAPGQLEKLKECGYVYLYKKKSRPSESCPEAEPRIEDSGEPMDLSTPSKSPEIGIPLDLSTPSSKASPKGSPGPLSSVVDKGKEKSLSTSSSGSMGVNLNDWMMRPVIKTPSKAVKRVTPSQTPIASPSIVSSQGTCSFESPSKKHRMSLPSPGKRYLQDHPKASQEGALPESESITELAEMLAFGNVAHEPVKKNILHQSYQYDDILFYGAEDVTTWDSVITVFILIPKADKAVMVRVSSSSRATVAQLMDVLLTKYHSSLPFATPQLTHQGKVQTGTCISSLKGQTLIFGDGVHEEKHSGKLWSCVNCKDKNGVPVGYAKQDDYGKKHKSKDCDLFMGKALSKPHMKGWGKNLDKRSLPGPYGRPKGHVWAEERAGQSEASKPAPVICPTTTQKKDSITDKLRGVLGLVSSASINRPKRKAAEKPSIVEDSLLDEDDADEYDYQEVDEDDDEPAPQHVGGKRNRDVNYEAPSALRDECKVQQQHRRDRMKKAMDSEDLSSDHWIPDEQDLIDERSVFIARDFICQNNFGLATFEMHPASLERMKQGLEPIRKTDKEFVARTAGLYRGARRKVFKLMEKQLQRKIRIRHLWAFGQDELVRPINNMGSLIMSEIKSPTEQLWAYSTWKTLLGIQMQKASELRHKFKDGIKDADSMSAGEIDELVSEKEMNFLSLCRNAIQILESSDFMRRIEISKKAQTDKNRRDAIEFQGKELPDLSVALKKVFESPVVQKYYKRIFELAVNEEPVRGDELSDITNFLLVINSLQSPHRIQIWGNMTKAALLKALENPILTYFPYSLRDEDFDKLAADQIQYRYNKDARPDLPEDATAEQREALKGYSIQTEAHKTVGTSYLWINQGQMLVIRAYMVLVEKFAEQHPNLVYAVEGPLFVNQKMEKFKTEKRPLNTAFVSKIIDVGHLTPYDFRRMFATYVGSSTSNILRQYGAFAASHSEETQQTHYITRQVQEWRALLSQQFVREKILGRSSGSSMKNVKFSEKSQQKLMADITEMRQNRNSLYLERLAAIQEDKRATDGRTVHTDIKYALFKLIIELGKKATNLDVELGVSLYDYFFTGGNLQDHETRKLIMLLVDVGKIVEMKEAETLLENLCQFCSKFRNKGFNKGKLPNEMLGPAEVAWTTSIQGIFKNIHAEKRTMDLDPRVKELMSKFNAQHEFKYCFGNENLVQVCTKHLSHQKSQFEAVQQMAEEDCISGEEALEQVTERVRQCISKKKEEEKRLKEKRSYDIDRQAVEQTFQRSLAESSGPDNIPEAARSIQQIITPGKDERTFLEGSDFCLEIRDRIAVVRQTLPDTPHKQLDALPVIESEKSCLDSESDTSKRKRGMNIDDTIKLAFLTEWIEWSEVPFAHCISEHKSKKARHSVENIISKRTFVYYGKPLKFGDVTDNWITWYERLTKAIHGFSFAKKTSIISYVDRAMREKFGPPEDNHQWTRENLRSLKDQIINEIQSQIPKD